MKNQILTAVLVGGLSMLTMTAANAQYTGPSTTEVSTVQDVLANAKDDTHVYLIGQITKQVAPEKYMFSDSTGEILVEIDTDVFAASVDDKVTVEIHGEFEKDATEAAEIDVESVTISQK